MCIYLFLLSYLDNVFDLFKLRWVNQIFNYLSENEWSIWEYNFLVNMENENNIAFHERRTSTQLYFICFKDTRIIIERRPRRGRDIYKGYPVLGVGKNCASDDIQECELHYQIIYQYHHGLSLSADLLSCSWAMEKVKTKFIHYQIIKTQLMETDLSMHPFKSCSFEQLFCLKGLSLGC